MKPGDSILVESGRLHAIDAGNLILEIQQNSDTTYRVYDWGRVGLDGRPRQLHVEESLKCIDWDDFEPEAMRSDEKRVVLADCLEFRLVKLSLDTEDSFDSPGGQPRLISVVRGVALAASAGKTTELPFGVSALLPAKADFRISAPKGAAVIVTDNFA